MVNRVYDKNKHFNSAKQYLESDDVQSIRHACLELRYLIEAHVYERLLAEAEKLPETVIGTWQPNKAIKMFLLFDDLADKDLFLTISTPGKEDIKIKYQNIPATDLNKIYNSLGSYLHLPMPKKASNYTINKNKIQEILEKLERLTEGNMIIRSIPYESFSCESCGKDILYTNHYIESNESIECQNDSCKTAHQILHEGDVVKFGSRYTFDCAFCKAPVYAFFSKIEDGYEVGCDSCRATYKFELEIRGKEAEI